MMDRPGRYRERLEPIVLAAYIFFFSIGAVTHALDFLRLGWRPYQGPPILLEAFWTSLVVLDLAVVVLLVSGARRAGIVLALAVMVCDVFANNYATFGLGYDGFAVALPLQAAVLGFVLGSMGFLWRTARRK